MAAVTAATQLEALLGLQQELALETDIDLVLTRIVGTATAMLDAERATLFVIDQGKNELWSRVLTEGTVPGITVVRRSACHSTAAASPQALRAAAACSASIRPYDDPRFDPSTDQRTGYRTRSILIAAIEARDRRRLGVLQVLNRRDGTFAEADEHFARALAGSAGISLEYLQLTEELAAERLRVVKVGEEERRRLARDLHDGVMQMLANAAIGIEIASKRAKTDVNAAVAELATLRERLVRSQAGLRDILFALRPLPLEDGGLPAAVPALAERIDGTNGSKVTARRMESKRRLKPEIESAAFTIIREAANNAVKTGRAPHVNIDVYDEDDAVVAMVEDDGKGFDVAAVLGSYASRGSLGLLQMRESARLIGAQLSLDSSVGNGTRIACGSPHEPGAPPRHRPPRDRRARAGRRAGRVRRSDRRHHPHRHRGAHREREPGRVPGARRGQARRPAVRRAAARVGRDDRAGSGGWSPGPPRVVPARGSHGRARDGQHRRSVSVAALHTVRDVTSQAELLRLKEDFLLQVAHELRTPIAALSATLDLLVEDALTMSREELGSMVGTLQRSALRLEHLVENLLDAGSIEAGTFQIRTMPTSVRSCLAGGLVFVQPLLDSKRQQIVPQLHASSDRVLADPRRTGQVLANLLANASKYAPEATKVFVATATKDGYVRVTVRDEGPGIPADEQARLFQRFFRSRTVRDQAGGLGLGLSICRAIVHAQGGEIGIDSAVGRGTSVHFTLPKARHLVEEAGTQ